MFAGDALREAPHDFTPAIGMERQVERAKEPAVPPFSAPSSNKQQKQTRKKERKKEKREMEISSQQVPNVAWSIER